MCAQDGPHGMPMQVIQGLRGRLPLRDLRAARLACRCWATEFGALVPAVLVPAAALGHGGSGSASAAASANGSAEHESTASAAAGLLGRANSDPDLAAAVLGSFQRGFDDAQQQRQQGSRSIRPVAEAAAAANDACSQSRAAADLSRLAAAFPAARAAVLACEGMTGSDDSCVDAESVTEALAALGSLKAARSLALRGLAGDRSWQAALGPLQAVAPRRCSSDRSTNGGGSGCSDATPAAAAFAHRLTELRLLSAALPAGACAAGALSRALTPAALPALAALELDAPSPEPFRAEHVAAIARASGLKRLALRFRAGAGGWAAPLLLDPLSRLTRLESLVIDFVGFDDLGRNVHFSSGAALGALPRLRRLALRRLGAPSSGWAGLERAAALRELDLKTIDEIDTAAARALACACARHVTKLEAGPLAVAALPELAALTRLRSLSAFATEPRGAAAAAAVARRRYSSGGSGGGAAAAAAEAVCLLDALTALTSLALAGPLALSARGAARLAKGLRRLHSLSLTRVTLVDGAAASLSLFSSQLTSLVLAPRLVAGVDGSSSGVCIALADLPRGLCSLECDGVMLSLARSSSSSGSSGGICCCLSSVGDSSSSCGGGHTSDDGSSRPSSSQLPPLRRLALRGLAAGTPPPPLAVLSGLRDLEIAMAAGAAGPTNDLLEAIAGAAGLTRLVLRCCPRGGAGAGDGRGGGAAQCAEFDNDGGDGGRLNGWGAALGAAVPAGAAPVRAIAAALARAAAGALTSFGTTLSNAAEARSPFAVDAAAATVGDDSAGGGGGPSGVLSISISRSGSSMSARLAGAASFVADVAAGAAAAGMIVAAAVDGGDNGASGSASGGECAGTNSCSCCKNSNGAERRGAAAASSPPAPRKAAAARQVTGLALLGRLTQLRSLELEVEEAQLLGASSSAAAARTALRALPALRAFAVAVRTDRAPGQLDGAARALAAWLAPSSGAAAAGSNAAAAPWQELRVRVDGPCVAGAARRALEARLAAALPAATVGAGGGGAQAHAW